MKLKVFIKIAIVLIFIQEFARVMLKLKKLYKYHKNMIELISKILIIMQQNCMKHQINMTWPFNIIKNHKLI